MIRLDSAPNMINKSIAIFALLFPASLLAAEMERIQQLLDRMQHAAHMLNYDGTFVYSHNNKLNAMRLIHGADKNGERERLVSLDSTGREVIRDKKGVTCYLPDSNAVVVEKNRPPVQFPPPFPKKIDQLTAQYTFSLQAEEKVAGQLAQKLVIAPKDRFRYGHELWIDKKTGLLLKTHLLNEKGKPVEQFMFTHIKYMKHVPDKFFKPAVNSKKLTWYEANEKQAEAHGKSKRVWRINKLPEGFKRDHQGSHHMPTSNESMDHLVFSDGLASISVFIEANKGDDSLVGGTRMGAVNAHGHTRNGYHITAVGEVPHATVKLVSESIESE